jgi:16S rRNA (guanine1516-N2)-methyltransferase
VSDTAPGGDARGFFCLETIDGRVALRAAHRPDWKPMVIDWQSSSQRSRIRGGRRQPLARALGLHLRTGLRILDATGGLGRDAFTLAALGEHQPLVVELLRDAQRHARASDDPAIVEAADRLRIVGSDALELDAAQGPFDAVYLDPMYPDDGKAALPQKEMQMLRALAGDDPDADRVLAHARALAPRVAVKRPSKAPSLSGPRPDAVVAGTQARFDLYLSPRP